MPKTTTIYQNKVFFVCLFVCFVFFVLFFCFLFLFLFVFWFCFWFLFCFLFCFYLFCVFFCLFVLFCFVLFCFVLFCFVLFCFVFFFTFLEMIPISTKNNSLFIVFAFGQNLEKKNNFFRENLLIKDGYEYNYIAEIKF